MTDDPQKPRIELKEKNTLDIYVCQYCGRVVKHLLSNDYKPNTECSHEKFITQMSKVARVKLFYEPDGLESIHASTTLQAPPIYHRPTDHEKDDWPWKN